ncbi:hypothetical protein [Leisingera sp. M523]|uniref:hypothetical protein n=1 Tax=Leisingera sp. M523 TaxID=2867013 RepID=UPI0021A6D4C9|nr:hypothetical protein [Leisingera sp. M523]UWQ29891.1 hypothetical protein K3557_04900 [Leisingera sp. M523]
MNKIKRIIGPTIALHGGGYFDFEAPGSCDFTIDDIAHALSHLCRFTGHCQRFYSVAEHSVHASRIVEPGFELEALLHDAAEAFIGDIAAPLKSLLPDYAVIEDRVENAVLSRLGVPVKKSAVVKLADLQMLKAEQAQAMGHREPWALLAGLPDADVHLKFWTPEAARAEFVNRYQELTA